MKRHFATVIVLTTMLSLTIQAQNFYSVTPSGHRLYYSITSATDHTVSVVSPSLYEDASFYNNQFWGHDEDLVIPDTVYNGGVAYCVTGIGSQALNVPMHSLTIPRSMRTIGYHAFASPGSDINNYSVKNNTMRVLYFNADSLEYSGGIWTTYNYWMPAFEDCTRLDTVYIGEHVKYLPKYLFNSGDSLRCVIMGDSVHTIDTSAIGFCLRLDSVRVSPSLRYIGPGAFYNSRIRHINLPDGLRFIGAGAFTDCDSLKEVMIPNTVDSIGNSCFFNCRNMQRVRLSNNMTRLPDDCFVYCYALSDMDFGTSLQVISERAFYQCQSLTTLTLPASLDTLKHMCFSVCPIATITLLSTTPPVTMGNIFASSQNHSIPVYIPCGTYSAYHAASTWSSFPNLIEHAPFSLSVQVNDTSMGYVVIENSASCTQPVVLTATSYDGYHFSHWNDGDISNPRTVTLTADVFLTAFFTQDSPVPDTVWRTITVTANIDSACEPYGSGIYADSSTVEIGYTLLDTATVGGHWQFLGWSDGPTENPRNITVTSDTAIVALFQWVDETTTQAITQSHIEAISVFPNPSHGDVTISVDRPSVITVLDMQGRTVIPATPVNSDLRLTTSDLPKGIYLVCIGTTAVRKIVVL